MMIDKNLVFEVVDARRESAAAKKRLSDLKEIYAMEYTAAETANTRLLTAESNLRTAVLAEYETTGEKDPGFGLKVREKTVSRLVYDVGAAVEFAMRHPEFKLMRLDVERFENAAAGLKLDFVEVETTIVATPTIPKELKFNE